MNSMALYITHLLTLRSVGYKFGIVWLDSLLRVLQHQRVNKAV